MQIHELNSFDGSVSGQTYLAIDDGTETQKIGADSVGVTTAMTVNEASSGSSTSKRVITPAVLKSAITTIMTSYWPAMTQSEAEAGTSTSKRVITPSVFKSAVTSIINTLLPSMTNAEAEAGTVTSRRAIAPSVLNSVITSIANALLSAFTDRFVLHTGTATTSASGTASFSTTYNTSEYACLSIWATGAVDGYFLAPYKYGAAAGGRWGFIAKKSATLEAYASTSVAYAALLYRYTD